MNAIRRFLKFFPAALLLAASLILPSLGAQAATPATSPPPSATAPANAAAAPPLDLSPYDLQTVYSNDFSQPQNIAREEDFIKQSADGTWKRTALPPADAVWIAEGAGGVEIRNGQLRVAPSPFDSSGHPQAVPDARRSNMVVWNRQIFPADFLLAFDMSPGDSTSGLTIVLFGAAGKNGEDLFDLSLPPRRADYPAYHSGAICNYTDAYWSRNANPPGEPLTNRLRKNPGFHEVAAGPSLTSNPTDLPCHVRILKVGPLIAVEINGHVILQWHDPAPLGAGRIGFRSMSGVTTVSYTSLKVSQVTLKPTAKNS